MKVVEKKVAFYAALAAVIRDEKFVWSSAQAVEDLFEEIKSGVTVAGITRKYIRDAFDEYHDNNAGLDTINDIVGCAFADMHSQMKWPKVREVFHDLLKMSSADHELDLFAHIANVRKLGGDAAVVTLVVSNFDNLKNLLEQNNRVEKVHLSL